MSSSKIDFVNQVLLYLDGEVWVDAPDIVKDIDMSVRYEVSNFGRVRTKPYVKWGRNIHGHFSYTVKPKISQQVYNKDKYLLTHVSLNVDGVKYKRTVGTHRLVCTAFNGIPKGINMQVNHINGDKTDNIPCNLEWVSGRDNVLHSYATGLACNKGERHPASLFTHDQVKAMRYMREYGASYSTIAEKFGAKYDTVWKIVNRVNYSEVV